MMKLQFTSLKSYLTTMVVAIISVMTAIIIIISYNASYSAVDKAYVNQLNNFSTDIEKQIVRFYDQQISTAVFFSKDERVLNAIEASSFEVTNRMFASFVQEQKIYENIFISTAESNPRITSAVVGIGTQWGNAGYDDNLKNNLNGLTYASDPRKSPVTGQPVSLFSAPVIKGKTVIGIIGLAVNTGTFSNQIIKDIKIAKTGFPYLVTLDGITFAHPNKEYIFKLDIKKYDWGNRVLKAERGEIVRYTFDGKDKIIAPVKNDKYRFITGVTVTEDDMKGEARFLALILLILGLVSVLSAGGLIYFIIKNRLSPLDGCRDILKKMAVGELSERYTGSCREDEIGEIVQSVNTALDQFEHTITGIIIASQNVAQAVEQIASGNQNLSQRTSEQASSLEEIASTIEEAAATVTQNADNANTARDHTTEGAKKSTESNKIALEAVNSILDMNDSSKKIVDIIAVINEIAFQTNLLALNAAVEAARAGDQGRGFAVVAGEVRNLAQRSGNAAREIETLIKDTVSKVEKSTDMVNKTAGVLSEIEVSAKSTAQLIDEIASASLEQKQGIEQINTAITEMDTMTQQNASLVEETASASEEMANQAQELLGMVQQFKLSGNIKSNNPTNVKTNGKQLHASSRKNTISKSASVNDGNGGNAHSVKSSGSIGDYDNSKLKHQMKEEGFEEF